MCFVTSFLVRLKKRKIKYENVVFQDSINNMFYREARQLNACVCTNKILHVHEAENAIYFI